MEQPNSTITIVKKNRLRRWIDRYRMEFFLSVSFLLQIFILFFWYTPSIQFDRLDRLVDEVAFVDNLVIQEPNVGEAADDGEFEVTDTIKKKEDLRIAGAQDAIISGATAPVDLTPNITPDYPNEARSAGITGTSTLEVIIAENGQVLRVRSVGKSLGFGLDEAAIEAFYKKRYSPSILEGKPITVKVLIPVRFSLY
ncbi:energy transducer TonB [Leptospira interrogans]|uniref:Energy transducer TonB n=1 Tax=Leptospira interrogans serovar Pomona TaxID=44276 RepID=A0AA41BJZ3_LEPIR|nr:MULTISPECIES: energy transducer TonB [Leptospira]EJO80124.1 TonB-dependent receptor [Leptospira interrogans serovar Pomona str. Kennewicki LC82-25]EKN95938.1 TonB-dependent receptor [Leptospira interrogans serovar Pomona str. Pomona]EMF33370.1 TonB-dependent receptor [Leptospira interrogans serovar Pomona str. Fox 32256]EMI70708.1 TonB-dependent receptor [Leptospira interrogans serovar Pomona str. CSL10083]EMJ61487.1 TonB-dependent receptor [Leptospira interrogans serovar Pomona str. CSL400